MDYFKNFSNFTLNEKNTIIKNETNYIIQDFLNLKNRDITQLANNLQNKTILSNLYNSFNSFVLSIKTESNNIIKYEKYMSLFIILNLFIIKLKFKFEKQNIKNYLKYLNIYFEDQIKFYKKKLDESSNKKLENIDFIEENILKDENLIKLNKLLYNFLKINIFDYKFENIDPLDVILNEFIPILLTTNLNYNYNDLKTDLELFKTSRLSTKINITVKLKNLIFQYKDNKPLIDYNELVKKLKDNNFIFIIFIYNLLNIIY